MTTQAPTPDPSHIRMPSWLIELGATAALLVLLGLLALPTLLERRDQARSLTCDAAYILLRDEVASELDSVLSGGETRCGQSGGNSEVLSCTLLLNADDANPRNRRQTAFTTAGDAGTGASSCRVGLTTQSTNGIRFSQFEYPASSTSRTFSITIED